MSTAPDQTPQTSETTTESQGLLDEIITNSGMVRHAEQVPHARDVLRSFIDQIVDGAMVVSADTQAMINQRIAQIDQLLSRQLDQIIHHEDFQKLEGSWRGLHYLVHNSETGTDLKIRALNASKKDLLRDMKRAAEFDQSALFVKVYEEQYGTFGGEPYGALIGDYEFDASPMDMSLLEKISGVAAAAHAPFISAAHPYMFNLDSFEQIGQPRDLSMIFTTPEYVKWRSFRDTEDSRYVGLCLPHILMRLPYGPETNPVDSFTYREDVDGTDHGKYLWGNAAYAFGTRLTEAYARFNWCTAIRGPEGGGAVMGLHTHTFKTDEGDVALKCPTEIAITDRRDRELSDNGFISLVHCQNTDYSAFFSGQSAQKPRKYNTPQANANAELSTRLPYIFAVSRIAHYLKAMMRDRVGSFMSRTDCERFLNDWISQYVIERDDVSPEQKASHPLRQAQIEVAEVEGKPGSYQAVAYLRPHYQLEELTVSMRLVAELPQGKGG